ncbi:dihydropteroate synthase [Micromonospora inositola]|uniref:dihydropteroate synthase n=1 Tax=Micromonospora inositola TaxID=47865 RepID=UPI000B5AD8A8|nr:dihydropteroate synthase [Micromonospora inositola]
MTDLVRAQAPVVMGVLNVTPDSFSDGGRYADLDAAVGHGVRLRAAGADLVDVGGESTRPGADRVDPDTEIARVLPVIRELAAAGIPVSIDTSRARVADAALAAGADVVNDVSGGLADPDMARVVRDAGCPWVLMHWRGHSREMRDLASYTDVVADVRTELGQRVDEALAAGVAADRIIVDPGLGFAKTAAHNWELSARLPELLELGFPLLFGASRKSYLGRLLAGPDGTPRPTAEREAATVATSLLAVTAGAWGVRVHDVRATADALAVWAATGRPRLGEGAR